MVTKTAPMSVIAKQLAVVLGHEDIRAVILLERRQRRGSRPRRPPRGRRAPGCARAHQPAAAARADDADPQFFFPGMSTSFVPENRRQHYDAGDPPVNHL